KPVRVTLTLSALVALVVAVFTVPLPVSRVYADGIIEIDPVNVETVPVNLLSNENPNEKVILTELLVRDGQEVKRNDELPRFRNRKLDADLVQAQEDAKAVALKIQALRKEGMSPLLSEMDRQRFTNEIVK